MVASDYLAFQSTDLSVHNADNYAIFALVAAVAAERSKNMTTAQLAAFVSEMEPDGRHNKSEDIAAGKLVALTARLAEMDGWSRTTMSDSILEAVSTSPVNETENELLRFDCG